MKELTPEEYRVMREGETEAPFSGAYIDHHEAGVYRCKACGNVLFDSKAKFDSDTGLPSSAARAGAENVGTRPAASLGMARPEVYCKHCDTHLGPVFDDGPA